MTLTLKIMLRPSANTAENVEDHMTNNETIPSIHWFERIRQVAFFAAFLAAAELAWPTPYLQSFWGRAIWAVIAFFIAKNLIRYKRETSIRFNKKVNRTKARYDKYILRLSDGARFRLYRFVRVVAVLYIWGWMVNSMSEKCNDAVSCVIITPSLIMENFMELIMFAIRLAMGMVGIFFTMGFVSRHNLFEEFLPHTIETRFTDVYGQPNALRSIKEVVEILANPRAVEELGAYMPGGILLTGPPGTGKTLIAKAVAGEINTPMLALGPDAFKSMWVGGSDMKVRQIFKVIRKRALKYGGLVVFMDEADSLGSRGGLEMASDTDEPKPWWNFMNIQGNNSGLNTFLAEMQGLTESRGVYNKIRKLLGFEPIPPPKYNILWIFATNLSGRLDPALMRPGRIDRIIPVGYPDKAGIIETLQGYLDKVNHNVTREQIELLAVNNPQSTGATIKNTVNEALLAAIRDGRDSITWEDMRDAIIVKRMGDELGRTKNEEDNRRVTLHEAAHATAAILFQPDKRIQFASVVRRGNTGGVVSSAPVEERFTQTRNELEGQILVFLASVWAEKFYFNDNISTGPGSDLEKATKIAKMMFGPYAMGNSVVVQKVDDLTADRLADVDEYMNELYEVLADRMYKYRDVVELIAQELDKHGTIDGDVCYEIFERVVDASQRKT